MAVLPGPDTLDRIAPPPPGWGTAPPLARPRRVAWWPPVWGGLLGALVFLLASDSMPDDAQITLEFFTWHRVTSGATSQ